MPGPDIAETEFVVGKALPMNAKMTAGMIAGMAPAVAKLAKDPYPGIGFDKQSYFIS